MDREGDPVSSSSGGLGCTDRVLLGKKGYHHIRYHGQSGMQGSPDKARGLHQGTNTQDAGCDSGGRGLNSWGS